MEHSQRDIRKLLVANRGEIAIRVFRAANELNMRTVAVYTFEDRYSLHRYKADEAYQIGTDDDPLKPYLDMEEIINLAKQVNVDAIHPGYGFLSENVQFARRCREEGIKFVGPDPEVMERLGDKIAAKKVAREVGVPIIEDNKEGLTDISIAKKEAKQIGYPVILKAAAGGGGRGMRVIREEKELEQSFKDAQNEARRAFGDETIFMEKYVEDPKHLEVQIMGDEHGNIVHLYERDCSVQRRFQKVVEVAPCMNLPDETRQKLFEYALQIARHVNYNNVGTIEFLVDPEQNIYFIEVNPRIQVEHTITEEVTGVDIVRSQLVIAKGGKLSDPEIYFSKQEDIECNGFAIQCRITTEDPENNFKPDYGRIVAYRNAAGFGIRLDEGSSYPGVQISPFFDSMLVKVSSKGRSLAGAAFRLNRALQEFRIRGVKTNIAFLENVITHPVFLEGKATVKFIDTHPELFEFRRRLDRGTKVLRFLSNVIVNGNPDVKSIDENKTFRQPHVPEYDKFSSFPKGSKDRLNDLGRDDFIKWLKEEKSIQYTDTTFRDAHQSLLATRVRTHDMLKVAESWAKHMPQVFSMEVWGGATFDVAMRFLHESPWERLQLLREAMPNLLLQMLLRGSNAVGYTAYPDNLIVKFVEKSWENGIDIFRIFDSLNWLEAMKVSIKAVRENTGALAEVCICYTGDILDPNEDKYTLQYYLDLARRIEDEGAHILAIKDMAGLLKPFGAKKLVEELKKSIDIPVHLHTHDTSGLQVASYQQAVDAGVDVIDVALSSMSGLTSQPNFNSVASMFQGHEREQKIDVQKLNEFSNYWNDVRDFYYPFESGLKTSTAEVFEHEIPGGQYSNLRPQAQALGLDHKFETIKKNYETVNRMFGNIVKVTPSSKVVGDMAMYMTSNDLTENDIYKKGSSLSFPQSVKNFFKGDLGQPHGGFPGKLQKIILGDEEPYTSRPNAHLEPVDFEEEFDGFKKKFNSHYDFLDFLAYKLYPKVWEDFYHHYETYGKVMVIPTLPFFYGLQPDEEILVELEPGKTIMVKYMYATPPNEEGIRRVFFKLNGQSRGIDVQDESVEVTKAAHRKVEKVGDVGAPLQGKLGQILVKQGDKVKQGQPLFIIEAMKMESTVAAQVDGTVKSVPLEAGAMVQQDDLVVEIEQ